MIAGSLSASHWRPYVPLFINNPLNIQKLVVILPPKRPFNIWRGKSEALLRAGHFHKSMTSFPNPRQGKRPEKEISCLRKGFSFPRPAPVRPAGAASRILHPARQSFTSSKTRNIANISLHGMAGFDDDPRAAFGREGRFFLSHQSSDTLMR